MKGGGDEQGVGGPQGRGTRVGGPGGKGTRGARNGRFWREGNSSIFFFTQERSYLMRKWILSCREWRTTKAKSITKV